jgi:hypothetical protein
LSVWKKRDREERRGGRERERKKEREREKGKWGEEERRE